MYSINWLIRRRASTVKVDIIYFGILTRVCKSTLSQIYNLNTFIYKWRLNHNVSDKK